MKVLGIDTSTYMSSICLLDSGKILKEYNHNDKGMHSENLTIHLKKLLNELEVDINALDMISVSIGPGPFTALRVGIAICKGIAFAIKKPIVGIPSLFALANQCNTRKNIIYPIIDIRREEVYTAPYKWHNGTLKMEEKEKNIGIDTLLNSLKNEAVLTGPGVKVYSRKIKHCAVKTASEKELMPHASTIAYLACKKLFKKGEKVLPIYARKPAN